MNGKPSTLMRPAEHVGAWTAGWLAGFGDFWMFAGQTMSQLFRHGWRWRNWRLLSPQLFEAGTRSVPVLLVTGTAVGLLMAVQAYAQFAAAGLADRLGVVVNLSVVRELGPILAGLMVAGRVGGAMTAELGTMRVTEQIDAIRAMGADPIRHLVCPRFLACLLLTPMLTIFCDLMGVLAGYFISVHDYGISESSYWTYSAQAVSNWDIITGLVKTFFFGGAISLICCYKGFRCRPGAEGVGRATTEAFVASFLVLLIVDFFLAVLLQTISIRLWGFQQVL